MNLNPDKSKQYIFLFLSLFLISSITYFPSFKSDFLLDDCELIVKSETVKSPLNFKSIWLSDFWERYGKSGSYRPLLKQIWTFEILFWGVESKFPFILLNLFLHSLNAFLLFRLILKFKINFPSALASSLFYLVHPANSEIIINVVGQGELLTSLCLLSALNLTTFVIDDKNMTLRMPIILSIIILFISLWIKEQSILFAPLLFCFLLTQKSGIKRILIHFLIFVPGLLFYFYTRTAVLHSFAPEEAYLPLKDYSFLERLPFIFYIIGRYFFLLIFPIRLSAQYNWIIPEWELNKWANLFTISGIIVFLCICGLIVLYLYKKKFLNAFLFFSIFFVMLPFSHIMQIGSPFAERHLAHSLIFISILLSLFISKLEKGTSDNVQSLIGQNPLIYIFVIIFLMFLSIRTNIRASEWIDGITLWESEVKLSPKNYFARHNLGVFLLHQGKIADAKRFVDEALIINPTYPDAHLTRGEIALKEGDIKRAENHFRYAIRFGTDNPTAHLALANLLKSTGRNDEAIKEFKKAGYFKD